jgi:hypothetical protein
MNFGAKPEAPILLCYDGSDCAKAAIAQAEALLAPWNSPGFAES